MADTRDNGRPCGFCFCGFAKDCVLFVSGGSLVGLIGQGVMKEVQLKILKITDLIQEMWELVYLHRRFRHLVTLIYSCYSYCFE